MKPHKHAELIKAWSDGVEIEQRHFGQRVWQKWEEFNNFWAEHEFTEYRIKPKPQNDEWSYLIGHRSLWCEVSSPPTSKYLCEDLLRLKRDGVTGKIKSVEVLK